jgi:rhodanese-related sulfurtransferase
VGSEWEREDTSEKRSAMTASELREWWQNPANRAAHQDRVAAREAEAKRLAIADLVALLNNYRDLDDDDEVVASCADMIYRYIACGSIRGIGIVPKEQP